MIQTSYFAKVKNHPQAIAISTGIPEWFTGGLYKDLTPGWSIIREYKRALRSDNSCAFIYEDHYKDRYYSEVLNKLDPEKVLKDLDGKILCCFERSGIFCHRRIVADWLYESCGVNVLEMR